FTVGAVQFVGFNSSQQGGGLLKVGNNTDARIGMLLNGVFEDGVPISLQIDLAAGSSRTNYGLGRPYTGRLESTAVLPMALISVNGSTQTIVLSRDPTLVWTVPGGTYTNYFIPVNMTLNYPLVSQP